MTTSLQPGFYILIAVLLLLVLLLMVLIESVVLQLLHWGNLRAAWSASLLANIISAILTSPLLAMARTWGVQSLALAWVLSILIEGLVLNRIKPDAHRLNWLCAFLANTASYLILIYPSFRFA